jgi:hypothetical protein
MVAAEHSAAIRKTRQASCGQLPIGRNMRAGSRRTQIRTKGQKRPAVRGPLLTFAGSVVAFVHFIGEAVGWFCLWPPRRSFFLLTFRAQRTARRIVGHRPRCVSASADLDAAIYGSGAPHRARPGARGNDASLPASASASHLLVVSMSSVSLYARRGSVNEPTDPKLRAPRPARTPARPGPYRAGEGGRSSAPDRRLPRAIARASPTCAGSRT